MRALLTIAFLVFVVPASTSAQQADVSKTDRNAIRAVIEDQLAAFQQDDMVRAFSHASPMIQRKFGTPENFMRMVRSGYLPVYRPREVEFRDIVMFQGELTQQVFLVGPDHRPVVALYPMERQPDGAWKINGCYLVRAPDEAV